MAGRGVGVTHKKAGRAAPAGGGRAVPAKRKARRSKPGAWTDLFDPSFMDHVCEAVRCAIVNLSLGEPSMLHVSLRRDLLQPLAEYVADHWAPPDVATTDVKAALSLAERVEVLADRIEEGAPFDESVSSEVAAALRLAWLEFIAHGAGVYLYWVVPRQHAQRVNAPKGKLRGWPRFISIEDVAAVVAQGGDAATYDERIAALCERAQSKVPRDRRPPPGEPEAAAKRAYSAWLKTLKSAL